MLDNLPILERLVNLVVIYKVAIIMVELLWVDLPMNR